MRTIETTVYEFNELSDQAKQKALDSLRDIDHDWHEYVIDMVKEIASMIGIDEPTIYYSGFSSQGDGACFEGTYVYKKGALKTIKREFPTMTDLHKIVEALQSLQSKHSYSLTATVKHAGHYYHEMCTNIYIYKNDSNTSSIEITQTLSELMRDFMRWIYRTLEKEYEYQTSDEAVRENILANEYEFYADGSVV